MSATSAENFQNMKTASSQDLTITSSQNDQTNSEHRMENYLVSWSNEVDLLLNCIGFSVGIGNLWRFPYLAYKNGGGAFLIPYLTCTLLISFPLFFMELLIGQKSKLDPMTVWSFCPFFKGLGVSILLCTLLISLYYNVVMAYALFYILQTFREVLPWSGCFEWWGADENCYEINSGVVLCKSLKNSYQNFTNCTNASETAADHFWKVYVLDLSSGLGDIGTVKWDLALLLMATWIIVCVLLISRHHFKSRFKFKTIHFTALFPFIILTTYFFYALTLPGATDGLKELFIPKWKALQTFQIWTEAAETSIFSVGLGMGGLIIFGGKNNFHYNILHCSAVSCLVDTFASILASSVIFMVVGFLAEQCNLDFSEITLSGHGLLFATFPNAVSKMGISHLWAFTFFAMLFCLAIDTSIATTENIALGIQILLFPSKKYPIGFVIFSSVLCYLLGLLCVTNGGSFLVQILDIFGGGNALMGTVLVESMAFGWGYGVSEIIKDHIVIEGSEPYYWMKLCWGVVAPISLSVLFLHSLILNSSLDPIYGIPYPSYASALGWSIVLLIMLPIPIKMTITLFQHRKNLRDAFKSEAVWNIAVLETHENSA